MHVSRYNLVFDLEGRVQKLVVNPLSQSMDVVDSRDTELVRLLLGDRGADSATTEDLGYLIERGYVFNSAADEDRMLRDLVEKDKQDQYPFDFLLCPTFRCNLRCSYCFQTGNFPTTRSRMISRAYAERVFEAIEVLTRERRIASRPLLYLFGGEPLLRGSRARDTTERILSLAKEKGVRVGVITNGSNLDYYADTLTGSEVELVQVTVDGIKQIHDQRRMYANGRGTFDDIERGISRLLNSRVKLYIRVNLDSQNIDLLPRFADYAIEAGWDRDNVTLFTGPYRDVGCNAYRFQLAEPLMLKRIFSFYRQEEHTRIVQLVGWPGVDYVLHFLKTGRLPAPRVSYCISSYGRFVFDAEGYVYACGPAAGRSEHAIGTFYPVLSLDEVSVGSWRGRRFTDVPECRECRAAPLCGGGCTLQSLDKYQGTRPFCPDVLGNLQVALDYFCDEILARGADVHQPV